VAEIRPFRGIYYNQEKVNLGDVVTQPYDRISPEEQLEFYERSHYNICRIILGREEHGDSEKRNKYVRAREYFVNWIKSGVLLEDDAKHFYSYTMEYKQDGKRMVRRGFSALVKLEPFDSGVILPHERTFEGPKIDRLNLMRATHTNFGHIFMLYSEPEKSILRLLEKRGETKPFEEVNFRDVVHKVGRIDDPKDIQTMIEVLRDKQLLIADGHHRYSTAIDFRNELGAPAGSGCDYRLVTLFNMEDENMTILPTHRAVKNLKDFDLSTARSLLSEFFEIREFNGSKAAVESELSERSGADTIFVMYVGGKKSMVLKLRGKEDVIREELADLDPLVARLDVSILHNLVLDRLFGLTVAEQNQYGSIRYVSSIESGIESVDSGAYQVCFFVNGTRIQEVRDVARSGAVMPQKSTDFHPKLLTGMISRRIMI
jgi:uncharacterized protein (DUF1015 family)